MIKNASLAKKSMTANQTKPLENLLWFSGSCLASYLLTAGDVQDLGQLPEVPGHFLQQQLEAVPDHVHLLLGLQTVAALGVDQQLQRHVLERRHLELRVQQLLADLLRCKECRNAGTMTFNLWRVLHGS